MPLADPEVRVEKPPLPTLWLDSSVVIKLAKIDQGEALQGIEIERGRRLRELVSRLVQEGRLLCPEADQEEEYEAERLEQEVGSQFTQLSLGIRLRHRVGIFDSQVYYAMRAYCGGQPAVELPARIYFHGDPVQELNQAREQQFVFHVNLALDPELLARRAVAKAESKRRMEELRLEYVAKGQTYDAQFELENKGYADAMLEMLTAYQRRLAEGIPDFWETMGVMGFGLYLINWRHLGGQPPGVTGLYRFFCSSYFAHLPICRIRSQLFADLLTNAQPILPGDSMDVELLSVAIPLAHYVLTDRKMENRVRSLGIDAEWNTRVFS